MANERQLTHKEIKMINDLLDGQLNPEKAKQAFLHIEQDATLKAAYDKLRWTKSLLHQAPRRKVPHNFTLTRQMAQEATGFYKLRRQTFSIAGALASFLFVVLLAVQLVPKGFNAAMPMADMVNEVAMMEEAAEAPEMLQAMPVEEEVVEEAPEMAYDEAEAPLVEESVAENAADAEPTLSSDEAVGGGMSDGEEPVEEAAVDEGESEDVRFAEGVEEEDVGYLAEEESQEVAVEDSDEMVTKEGIPDEANEENQPSYQESTDWIFLATVLAGLLAFIFIFIAIRDRQRA